MGKHAAHRTLRMGVAVVTAGILTAAMFTLTRDHSDEDGDLGTTDEFTVQSAGPVPEPTCSRPLSVVTSASFAPVLGQLAPELAAGEDCVRINIDVADGRSGPARMARFRSDVWIPDDAAWAGMADKKLLAPAGTAGSGKVLATSPIYLVTDRVTATKLEQVGGSWLGLAGLLAKNTGVRMTVRDPGGSGDGLIAAGAVGEAVWLKDGMDASAMMLASALKVTRTVNSDELPLQDEPGEVGLVPEYALIPELGQIGKDAKILAGADHTALLRFTWLPSVAAAGDPMKTEALSRLLTVLTGPESAAALDAAHLRRPDAGPPPGAATDRLPTLTAKPFGVLGGHHVDHVFATWYAEDRRTNLLVVLDVSGSMEQPPPGSKTPLIRLVGEACGAVGELLPDDGRLGLWEFGSRLDPPRDHRSLLASAPMNYPQRKKLAEIAGALTAQRTGTGLYDTILAAYTSAVASYQPDVSNQVLLFTDGRNEDDPGSITAAELSTRLAAAQRKDRPVQLSVVAFGDRPEVSQLNTALEPVDGYVDPIRDPSEVSAAFVHVVAGGMH